ncbi:HAMP domain-containing sensor histidine kinase [Streptomyces sp. NPDC047000]|uniref:sensor histidine kinase n=1 Tax=Streptomyces sp. NPDC047000 TaxID=3155474 RepID=UPI0033CF8869
MPLNRLLLKGPLLNGLPRRLTPRTLRGRLSLVALTTAALLMTVLTVVFNVAVERHLRHQADDELRNRAAAVATTVDTRGPRVRVVETAGDGLLDANVWIYAGPRLLEKPPSATADGALTRTAGRLAARGGTVCATARSPRLVRMCSRPVTGRTGSATVVTAVNLAPYRSSADTLLLGSLILDAVMLACTYGLTRLAVGRALRPVRDMTDQATQWSAVGSDERFGTAGQPAELARLGTSLDALLDRIRTLLRYERQLTGELSHELRTPLTRIVIELDWWRARPRTAAETRATHEVIDEAARSMRTICDTLLSDARESVRDLSAASGEATSGSTGIGSGTAPGRTTPGTTTPGTTAPGATAVAPALSRLVGALVAPEQVKAVVEVTDPELEAGVVPALLERIVSPLLANAGRYARSTITVSARPVPGGIRISVTDDGPGVPESFTGDLFRPGRRADPEDGHDGAGLGLPLARRLARSTGGEVSHDPSYTGGARFLADLPAG